MNYNRRDFLRMAALSAGSLALAPYPLHASDFKTVRTRAPKRIIVIGAGLAGLTAAWELKKSGHTITILEAQTHAGGRVRTMRENLADGFYAELGAARIPTNHEWTHKYIKEFGLTLTPFYPTQLDTIQFMRNKHVRVKSGASPLLTDFPFKLTAKELSLGMDGIFEESLGKKVKFTTDRENWPVKEVHDLDDMTIEEYLKKEGWSPDVYELLGLKPFDNVSMLEAIRIIGNGHGSKTLDKIAGGNDLLPKAFALRLSDTIQYGSPVIKIEQGETDVTVSYKQLGQVKKISGDKVISAIPYSLLRTVETIPALSPGKAKVVKQMGYASLSRATYQVKKRYWMQQGYNGFGFSDVGAEIWHPTFDVDRERGLLQMYLLGSSSQLVSNMTPAQQENYLVEQMNRVFPGLTQDLEGVYVHCWENDPWARGAVRLINRGQVVEFQKSLYTPERNIHFAGEHTSTYMGYMNGAFESAARVVKEINEG